MHYYLERSDGHFPASLKILLRLVSPGCSHFENPREQIGLTVGFAYTAKILLDLASAGSVRPILHLFGSWNRVT